MDKILYWTIVLSLAAGVLVIALRLLRAILRHLFGRASSQPSDTWWDDTMDPNHPDHMIAMRLRMPGSLYDPRVMPIDVPANQYEDRLSMRDD